MGKAVAVALSLVIVASLISPLTTYHPMKAGEPEWKLLVFPFFLQVTPRDMGFDRGYAGVYVRTYGGLRAVVDLKP